MFLWSFVPVTRSLVTALADMSLLAGLEMSVTSCQTDQLLSQPGNCCIDSCLYLMPVQAVSNSIKQYQTVSNSIKQYQTVSNSIKQYQTVSNSIKQYQTVSNSIKQYQTVSNSIKQYQTVSISIKQYQTVSHRWQ